MLRRYQGAGGSALDLAELQREEIMGAAPCSSQDNPDSANKESRLRRVFTAHVRRQSKKPRHGGFSLNNMLKEPLRLVNSVPLNFDFGRLFCNGTGSQRERSFLMQIA
uniref:Gtpase activating rap/ran gap domain like protein 3 n=1 Tax=Rhipicephalus appendiculatus TaxID=34631 RepID=A0A131YVR2_RHIAP